MFEELKRFLEFMKPAFSRRTTYCWFVLVFVGFILRTDNFGVSSIIRALTLAPENYTCLLHFFHSTAWDVEGIGSLKKMLRVVSTIVWFSLETIPRRRKMGVKCRR